MHEVAGGGLNSIGLYSGGRRGRGWRVVQGWPEAARSRRPFLGRAVHAWVAGEGGGVGDIVEKKQGVRGAGRRCGVGRNFFNLANRWVPIHLSQLCHVSTDWWVLGADK
jgi:hypothetical protein